MVNFLRKHKKRIVGVLGTVFGTAFLTLVFQNILIIPISKIIIFITASLVVGRQFDGVILAYIIVSTLLALGINYYLRKKGWANGG